jgi:hypothetical protein
MDVMHRYRKCDHCGKNFTESEWDNRDTGHEPGCAGEGCDCDLVYHAACCPDCNTGESPYPVATWAETFYRAWLLDVLPDSVKVVKVGARKNAYGDYELDLPATIDRRPFYGVLLAEHIALTRYIIDGRAVLLGYGERSQRLVVAEIE